ncbi:MAG: DUF2029 domain-containing protein [Deltaproteobacteria bacterium]|nr:DUF2029 domain-containing protein [Deltaproteobacteria bacterium]
MQHLVRILSGEVLYASPSIDFVPYPYPPFYYYAAIPFTSLVGVNLLALRLVSLLATLASAAILFALVRHETRRWDLGVVAAGLFVATYRISGAYMDVGRIDSLFVALVLGGVYLLRVRDDSLDDQADRARGVRPTFLVVPVSRMARGGARRCGLSPHDLFRRFVPGVDADRDVLAESRREHAFLLLRSRRTKWTRDPLADAHHLLLERSVLGGSARGIRRGDLDPARRGQTRRVLLRRVLHWNRDRLHRASDQSGRRDEQSDSPAREPRARAGRRSRRALASPSGVALGRTARRGLPGGTVRMARLRPPHRVAAARRFRGRVASGEAAGVDRRRGPDSRPGLPRGARGQACLRASNASRRPGRQWLARGRSASRGVQRSHRSATFRGDHRLDQ